MIRHLKCLTAASLTGLGFGLLWTVGWLTLVSALVVSKDADGLGAVSGPLESALLVALAGFALGYWWMYRRTRPAAPPREQR